MTTAALIYPHQIFDKHPAVDGARHVVLVEDPLFFSQYRFHRQKLILHRASMKRFAVELHQSGKVVHYVPSADLKDSGAIASLLVGWKIKAARVVDPCDDWLATHLQKGLDSQGIALTVLPDPHFLTPLAEIERFTAGRKKLFFTDFYIQQRKRLDILLDDDSPVGGKWSFDTENRRKLPKGVSVPDIGSVKEDEYVREARAYVRENFPQALGNDAPFTYPTEHSAAERWLKKFVKDRLELFGDYEDAISTGHQTLFHSMLTPMLNTGLLSPRQVLKAVLAEADHVPLNSLEGFVRQVIGWREFMRLVYLTHGRRQRTCNYWKFTQRLPDSFYDATTGIEPVDHVIRTVLKSGYCHHIERLMIIGNFLLLCDIHPDAVYQWFMELFIDAYDWVMVPNVYGMSQHADGGLMTTKPYISGSSYVLKMSDFSKGAWCAIWDALYWRFIDRHSQFFLGNPRMAMMVKMKEKMGKKMIEHHRVADQFLARLHGSAKA